MLENPENGSREAPENGVKPDGRGKSPNSLANLRRGNQGPTMSRAGIEGPALPGESQKPQTMLEVMEHVLSNPASADTSYQQKEYRKWLKEDRPGFMRKRAELERPARRKEPEPVDDGDGDPEIPPCLERMFRDWGQEPANKRAVRAEEDARLLSEPGAMELGKQRQAALRKALEDEHHALRKLKELDPAPSPEDWEQGMESLFDDWAAERMKRAVALVEQADPQNVLASLQEELEQSRRRGDEYRRQVKEQRTVGVPG
jgi:hypothetical protein